MLKFTQGDTAVLDLTALLGNSQPVDLTGAVFTTTVQGPNQTIISFSNSQHTADPNQVTNRGKFKLTLSSSDTNSVPVGEKKEIVTQIVIGASTIYYHGKNLLTVITKNPTS